MEKSVIEVPDKEYIIIPASKIKIKRAAILARPRESGEKLQRNYLLDLIAGIFLIIASLALLLTFIFAIRNVWQPVLIVVGIIASLWFIGYFGKLLLKIVSTLISWVIFMLVMGFIITWFSSEGKDTEQKSDAQEYVDLIETDSNATEQEYVELDDSLVLDTLVIDSLKLDSVQPLMIMNSLHWSDYSFNNYSFDYQIDESNFKKARENRSEFVGYSWTAIYNNLYNYDKMLLNNIYQKYDSIGEGQNTLDFARTIVCSIQEVPYTWILPESCFDAPNQQEMKKSGYNCLGNVKLYGVQSPVEFMANQKGDCDTKTLILYSLLKHFNFDVCILTSAVYEHALLGINLPGNGKYKTHQGKKYYVWETTVKGLDIGQLHPEHSNMAMWEVAL